MRLDEFLDIYTDTVVRKDYEMTENSIHAKQLCYCKRKAELGVTEESVKETLKEPRVLLGVLVDRGIESILGGRKKVYKKRAGNYTIAGTPDIVDGDLVEVKTTLKVPDSPREHDKMQLRMYMWLLGKEKAYIWYFSPYSYREFEVTDPYTTDDIKLFIEYWESPRWSWECKWCKVREECDV
jgi:CRISPR/Cas system-associated exonuclease Cas4 (RecB family)